MKKSEFARRFDKDPLYEYVRTIAIHYMADYDDEWNAVDYCRGVEMQWDIENGSAEFFFTREEYDANEDIQNSLALIGLDADKFWVAVRFIHFWAESKFVNAHPSEEPLFEQMKKLYEALSENAELYVKCPGRRAKSFSGARLIEQLKEAMIEYCNRNLYDPGFSGRAIIVDEDRLVVMERSPQIYFEIGIYQYLFEQFCTDQGLPKRIKGQTGSRNKLLLISRLMYMTGLTTNPAFKNGTDPIKGIINKYKDKKLPHTTGKYFV